MAWPTVKLRLNAPLLVIDDSELANEEFNVVEDEISVFVGEFDWSNTKISGIGCRSVAMEVGKSPKTRLSFLAFLSRFIASGVEVGSWKDELEVGDGGSEGGISD